MSNTLLTPKWYSPAEVADPARLRPVQSQDAHRHPRTALDQGRQVPPHPARMGRRVHRRPASSKQTSTRWPDDRQTTRQRRRLDLPVPQRLRRLRLGRQTRRQAWTASTSTARPATTSTTSGSSCRVGRPAGPVATKVPTVGDYLAYWLREVVEPNLSPATWATYDYVSRCYLIPGLGKKRLDRLQTRDVQIWLNEVGRTCQCCAQGKDAKRLPAKRRCCAVASVLPRAPVAARRSTIFAACFERHSRKRSSTATSPSTSPNRFVLPAIRTHKRKAWTSEEARQFLESARADADPLYAAYVLILDPRTSEGRTTRPRLG